jgi:hypothetical protein
LDGNYHILLAFVGSKQITCRGLEFTKQFAHGRCETIQKMRFRFRAADFGQISYFFRISKLFAHQDAILLNESTFILKVKADTAAHLSLPDSTLYLYIQVAFCRLNAKIIHFEVTRVHM